VEAIRALTGDGRSARSERTQTINQARSLIVTGPGDLRARFAGHTVACLVSELAALRPRPGDAVGYATRIAVRELGRRAEFLDGQLARLDELIIPLVTSRAPGLLALYGVGPDTAALLLIAAGDHPGRLRSEAAWAHLCAVAPIPAFTAARRAVIASVQAGAATAGLPASLTTANRDRILAGLARCRITVDRNRHRDRKTKARPGFPAGGPRLATRTAAAEISVCGPLAA
jgi:hypothetical protein